MSDSFSPDELIERSIRLIKQQRELYGDFSTNIDPQNSIEEPTPKSVTAEEPTVSYAETTQNSTPQIIATIQEKPVSMPSKSDLIAQCSTLDELKALCEKEEVLRTDLEDTNLVFGVGNPNADLLIVGEAPGANEDKVGEPFVGRAGKLLDQIMEAINFKRDDIYIANILKHRPPNNRDPKPEERQRSLPYLLRQIELINPKLVLCVGRISATTLLCKDLSLKDMRQQFHEFHGRELMATYHPAALLRNPNWKRPTWEDVQMLRKRYDELGGKP